jgi:uncharacterized membrane protein YgcG
MDPEDQDYDQNPEEDQGGEDQGGSYDRYSRNNPSRNSRGQDQDNKNEHRGKLGRKVDNLKDKANLKKKVNDAKDKVKDKIKDKIDPRRRLDKIRNIKKQLSPDELKKRAKEYLKNIAKNALKEGLKKAAMSPWTWIIIGAIALIFLLIMIITGADEEENAKKCQGAPEISISLSGPESVKKDEEKEYTISLSNAPDSTTVTLKHGEDMDFVSAEKDGKDDNGTITWTMGNGDVKFKLKAKKDNSYVILIANAEGGGGGGGGDSSGSSGGGSGGSSAGMEEVRKIGKQYGAKWAEFLDAAEKVAKEEDYPLAVIVAQGAHESAHGTSNFAKNRNNFFGVNAVDANPNQATSYPTVEDGIKRYVQLIKTDQRYKAAYAARSDPKKMIEEIKKAGYATDPDYVNKVTNTPEFKALAGEGSGSGGTTGSGDCGGGGQTGATAEGYVPPSADTCGGKYQLNSPIKKNFGDPSCKFTKDELNKLLKSKDPDNADWWFNKVAPCESQYNPNAFNGKAVDAAGAWGLFQMGSAKPPGAPPPAPGKNGPNDRGDVNWEVQVTNAAAYLKQAGKGYWACK